MRALNPFAPFWYTPQTDLNEPEATRVRFRIRGLNGSEMGYVAPELVMDKEAGTPMMTGMTGKGCDLCLKFGLLDWENVANDNGPVRYSHPNFALIPFEVRVELAMQIIAASYVKPDEKKT